MLTESLKSKLVKLADAHQRADEYLSGHYEWNGGACSIGCTLRDAKKLKLVPKNTDCGSHATWGEASGIGNIMARLQDSIFEGLSRTNGDAAAFTPNVIRAIKCRADYSMAWPKFAIWLLRDELPKATKNERSLKEIDGVAILYEEWLKMGVKPSSERWIAVRSAAYAAAYAAADAAADAAAYAAAAYAAAYAADAAAAYAAAYAADAAAAYAAAYAADAAAAYAAAYAADAAAAYAAAAYAAAYAADAAADAYARKKFWERSAAKFIEILAA